MHQLKRLVQGNKTDKIIHLLESDALVASGPPPVQLLAYAIHAILSPIPEYSQLHDLINLLTMVEFWRIRAMSVVSTALVWQEYYTKLPEPDNSILLLNDHQEFLLNDHEESNSTWRKIFIKIIATCISTHLLRLWIHPDDDSHASFSAYWNQYFKALENPSFPDNLRVHQENHDPHLLAHPVQPFHHRLSISDIDQLLALLQPLVNYIRSSSLEPEDHLPHDEPDLSPTLDDPHIVLINDYLQYVPSLVNDVHNLFPEKLPLPW